MIRESRYNYEFSSSKGTSYICNGLSGSIIKKPSEPLTSPILSNFKSELLKHFFLCEDGVDEVDLVLQRNHQMLKMQNRLELTVMLHENCNFRCTYCFEEFENRKLTGKTLENLLGFIEERLPRGGELFIHFYGGEPLLAWDSLTLINSEIKRITNRKNGNYHFFITTNGSLLSLERCLFLLKHNVSHVKITLDGPPEIHDARRVMVDGGGTFRIILQNLRHVVRFFKVIIRVNLDVSNISHIPSLLDILGNECSRIDNLFLDYNILYDKDSLRLTPGVTYPDLYILQTATLDRGFRLSLPPLIRFRACKFTSENSYLIDTSGKIFLCSKTPECYLGSVNHPEYLKQAEKINPIVSVFRKPKKFCISCNLFPICGGGCTLLSLKNKALPCPPWKKHYDKYLQIQFRNTYGAFDVDEESRI